MNNLQAVLAGAALVVSGFMLASGVHPAEAQQHGGPYQLMHHSNSVANAGVFRLDTASGEVSYCFITSDNSLTCSQPVK